jgi:uncharacterized membrane protein YccF (DUF307 family)
MFPCAHPATLCTSKDVIHFILNLGTTQSCQLHAPNALTPPPPEELQSNHLNWSRDASYASDRLTYVIWVLFTALWLY